MSLKSKLKQIPTKPGVYRFKDGKGTILYIGKAKNLRNRVRSYFQKSKHQLAKNISMVKRIADLDWIVVGSEVEALLTEANLIKEHRPKYNIDLKDDKSYPYVQITKEPYPQVLLTREIVKDGSKYFGPFTDVFLLRKSLKALHKIFPVRSCSYFLDEDLIAQKKVKLCLDYHIKKCEGPCEGLVSEKQYNKMITRVIDFLHGRTKETEEFIQKEMVGASKGKRYEDAAMYRDQLKAIESFKARQRKVAADFEDRDVFAVAREDDFGIATIIRIRSGRILSREKISLRSLDEDEAVLMNSLITRFYLEADFIPKEITVPVMPGEINILTEWLKGKRKGAIKIHQPQRGEKAREVRLAFQNAKLLLGEWHLERKKRRELIPKMITTLQDDLILKAPPRRIEAFDISHLGGTNPVASMVCFVDGKAKKSQYRKYNVKTVKGIDDFASMREIVLRRYKRVKKEKGSLPDLILVDGGKGQLSMAVSALRELGLDYLPIVGLAKRLEEVFVPGQSDPQSIHKLSPGLILLRRIRDEAHRFAITFQKQKRTAAITESVFDSIKGMGPKRIQNLFAHFDSAKEIAKENPEIISKTIKIPMPMAKEIVIKAKSITKK
ncbi:MAG: excinuclease ABC subunit C [Candidatus Marinimicrobia bacterium]|jgi:excinuclease ABC subunit C|nr:excinuclease ABC subunit C [Candidatus Neomarinimicrobiota bacterium]MBT3617849.1 excinuclease ABC subunit C [Candidatus Neomarinimicrobiota bacterium]MBT3828206.1 excinuclease ABC subunit C [Candidatus Neomarinimicrobiota bacterium]MBT3997123.1 excinuclease ABC subunit C [Candidatus Neomarinimicrobiota bacterium]MBT4280589.1 excinuclease ABC subunit C [Candidatus Neomarinimicrobiota bacterium]